MVGNGSPRRESGVGTQMPLCRFDPCPPNTIEDPVYIAQQTKAKIRPCAALGCADYYYGSCCLEKCNRYQPLA